MWGVMIQQATTDVRIPSRDEDRDGDVRGTKAKVCQYCGQPITVVHKHAHTQIYCGRTCNQEAYKARKRESRLK